MRLDKFLNKALYSENGYYYNKKQIGKKKDFITAPEISQMFGEIIAIYLYYNWKTKINSKFNFIELGPGLGTLFLDIYKSVSHFPEFLNSADISFIEINRKLKKLQKHIIIKVLKWAKWLNSINYKYNFP